MDVLTNLLVHKDTARHSRSFFKRPRRNRHELNYYLRHFWHTNCADTYRTQKGTTSDSGLLLFTFERWSGLRVLTGNFGGRLGICTVFLFLERFCVYLLKIVTVTLLCFL